MTFEFQRRCLISKHSTTSTESSTPTRAAGAYGFAVAAAELAYNTRCEEVTVLDLRGRSPVTEFFVIATGTSPRQMRTVVDEIRDLGKEMGFAAWQTSGLESGRWILLDCVNVVCHVFDSESRDFYDLELLWGDCPRIDWRKELGLPEPPAGGREVSTRERFEESSGLDEIAAEEEEARLEGVEPSDQDEADIEEEEEADAPVVVELPDESSGSDSVEFVEIDPPGKRRKRGRAVYPTPIVDEEAMEGEESLHIVDPHAGSAESLDEDEKERQAEDAADADVEAVSAEDLPAKKIVTRPMGGVSAGLSSTLIGDSDEEEQTGTHGDKGDREPPAVVKAPSRRARTAKPRAKKAAAVKKKPAKKKTPAKTPRAKKAAARKKPSPRKPAKKTR